MALYESVFITRQDVSQAQVDGFTETFEKIITDQGGTVPKKESWGLRALAYKIKKNRKGYYVLMNIDGPSDAIREMERQMHLNEDVIRFLTTRVDTLEEGPSAIMKAKERGDDRDRGRRDGQDGGYNKFDKPGGNFGNKAAAPTEAPDAKAAETEDVKEAAKDEAPATSEEDDKGEDK